MSLSYGLVYEDARQKIKKIYLMYFADRRNMYKTEDRLVKFSLCLVRAELSY